MKRILQTFLFVVLATTILLFLLKLAHFPGITWAWVVLPIFGPLVLWFLVLGMAVTAGLVWSKPEKPFTNESYRVERLRVDRELLPAELKHHTARHTAYYRKAIALELATLAHDTPGFITWEERENRITGELKILVKND